MNEQDALEACPLTADTVAEFLQKHPDFFVGRDELLQQITIPHDSGGAISLLERQVSLLRERNEDQLRQIDHLMDMANANDVLFEKTRSLILALLKCRDIACLSSTLTEELGRQFSNVESQLFFITDERPESDEEDVDSLTRKTHDEAKAVLGEFFERKRTFCGRLSETQASFFFPETQQLVASAAIVPVHVHLENGAAPVLPILVSGSPKPDYFHGDQDTLFLDFIGEVLAVLISNLLDGQDD